MTKTIGILYFDPNMTGGKYEREKNGADWVLFEAIDDILLWREKLLGTPEASDLRRYWVCYGPLPTQNQIYRSTDNQG